MSDVPREFVFTRYPARQGMAWLRTAYHMFSKHRGAWILVFVGYVLILFLVGALPFVGDWLVPIVNPLFAVGILAAAWHEERGAPPSLNHLLQGFHSNVAALLAIGVFLLVGFILASYASVVVDGGRMQELRSTNATLTQEEFLARVTDRRFQLGMLVSTLIAIPLVIASWWASALVVFQDASPVAAIATSVRAGVANWRALVVYILALSLYGALVPAMLIALVAVLVPAPVAQILLLVLVFPYVIVFIVTFHVSYYVSYRDVFHANETLAPLSRGA